MSDDGYTYRVIWAEEDDMYVGLCDEFSLLSALADTPEEALAEMRQVVGHAIAILQEDGAPIPQPHLGEQG